MNTCMSFRTPAFRPFTVLPHSICGSLAGLVLTPQHCNSAATLAVVAIISLLGGFAVIFWGKAVPRAVTREEYRRKLNPWLVRATLLPFTLGLRERGIAIYMRIWTLLGATLCFGLSLAIILMWISGNAMLCAH